MCKLSSVTNSNEPIDEKIKKLLKKYPSLSINNLTILTGANRVSLWKKMQAMEKRKEIIRVGKRTSQFWRLQK